MRIGKVARRTGIPASAIRYYETEGIIARPERDSNGYRRYDEATVAKLLLIKDAQRLGFSLETISGLFLQDGSCSLSLTVAQINERLKQLGQIEADLQRQRSELLILRDTLEDSLRTGIKPFSGRGYRIGT
ncbi:Transcriptional regulator, MerR family protein [Sodalis praecaptivus]|uniref:Transcriptional regulator, MerR family protein n=1 Tax=Sodalis praecaptivus TaxID=1239307 RepID=W0HWZ1_9GAMM|nr:MerR family transcriptional regulator [Sodalis praecaptivus]AHF77017.1 Transcriptional regulator, MerR family protein [Sodalis praecaptivus]